jgi:hypothetical protein
MDEIDISPIARLLAQALDHGAVDLALARLRDLSAVGDISGCAMWSRVLAATNRMQSEAAEATWQPRSGGPEGNY